VSSLSNQSIAAGRNASARTSWPQRGQATARIIHAIRPLLNNCLDGQTRRTADQRLDVDPFDVPPARRVQRVTVEVEYHLSEAFGRFADTTRGVLVGFDENDALPGVRKELSPHLRRDRRRSGGHARPLVGR